MNPFPISVAIYLFIGIVVLAEAYRAFRAFMATGNKLSKALFKLGIILATAEFLFGFSVLFAPKSIIGAMYVIGITTVFLALNYGIKITLLGWGLNRTENITKILVPVIIFAFAALQFRKIPSPFLDQYGLMHWNIPYPLNIITFLFGVLLAILPGIFLLKAKTENKKTAVKKTLFSTAFFLGRRGWLGDIAYGQFFIAFCLLSAFFLRICRSGGGNFC